MYHTANGNIELFNEMAQFAMLTDLFWKIELQSQGCEVVVNGIQYDSEFEFVADFKNKPETVKLIMEEFKKEFLYAVADSKEKPSTWTPDEYMDWYYRTFQFICDKDVYAPSVEDWTPFDEKYNKDGKNFDRMELILDVCFRSAWDDDFIEDDCFNTYRENITDKKSFIDACKKMLNIYGISTENTEYIDCLVADADERYKDLHAEDKTYTKKDSFKDTFECNLGLYNSVDFYMYDCDFMFYYEGYTDEEIPA